MSRWIEWIKDDQWQITCPACGFVAVRSGKDSAACAFEPHLWRHGISYNTASRMPARYTCVCGEERLQHYPAHRRSPDGLRMRWFDYIEHVFSDFPHHVACGRLRGMARLAEDRD